MLFKEGLRIWKPIPSADVDVVRGGAILYGPVLLPLILRVIGAEEGITVSSFANGGKGFESRSFESERARPIG